MKKAFITGVAGQDGSYLSELLLLKGYEVFGLDREGSNLENVPKGVKLFHGDLGDHHSLVEALNKSVPDEVYNLGGISDLKTAYAEPEKTMDINYRAVGVLLNEALRVNKNVRFLQASSSEIFIATDKPLNEESERDWSTESPYAKAKMMADRDFIAVARESRKVFACSAILFTHDSPRRSLKGAMRRFISTLVKIKLGVETCLSLGNIDMKRDWGFAGDYVEAMWRMLQMEEPKDLVLANAEAHSVKDIIDTASKLLGIKLAWHSEGVNAFATDSAGNTIVRSVPEFFKPAEEHVKIGDASEAEKAIKWKPKVGFEKLVSMMVKSDIVQPDLPKKVRP